MILHFRERCGCSVQRLRLSLALSSFILQPVMAVWSFELFSFAWNMGGRSLVVILIRIETFSCSPAIEMYTAHWSLQLSSSLITCYD